MDETRFDELADTELQALVQALGALEDRCDIELGGGILTIEFDDGTKFVVNSHRAARQIWLATGLVASHCSPEEKSGRWLDSKTGADLRAILADAVGRKLGAPVSL